MKKYLFLLVSMLGFLSSAMSQTDSVDVLHYSIEVDLGHLANRAMIAKATVTVDMLNENDTLVLDLIGATVDSVKLNGNNAEYRYDGRWLKIATNGANTVEPTIYYRSNGKVESYGWGGLHMDANLHYSLGVAFQEFPHNYGRSWMPCRDNFYDKATYEITATTKAGWHSLVSGVLTSRTINQDGSETTKWSLNQLTPTYLVGIAAGPYNILERSYAGEYGTYPAMIGHTRNDSTTVAEEFDILNYVVPMYERCFGPYRWERIGYAATTKGSMEHASNIALVNDCMGSNETSCLGVVVHELAHAWFGNLVTCASSADMWFNEGGATFSEEVAMEAAYGKGFANSYYQNILYTVLTRAHVDDGNHVALHGVTQDITYGTTTYKKGGIVWHSLRGYLGDSVFYSAIKQVFNRCAFGNIDAYQLRDSLSLYTGVDLRDFFDFHVFNPGYVDYHIDSLRVAGNRATVAVHQHIKAAPALMNSNRVPITFFSPNLETCKRWIAFDGERVEETFDLPFEAMMAYVDADQEISDAATDAKFVIDVTGVAKEEATTYFSVKANELFDTAYIRVAHHFSKPDSADNPGVLRMANRYWTVVARMNWNDKISGRFRYERGISRTAIDYGFFNKVESLDSMALLYRKDAGEDWKIVSRHHSSNTKEGSFIVDYLRPGDYTLAVVDTNIMSADAIIMEQNTDFIAPNPSAESFKVMAEDGVLEIMNMSGKRVLKAKITSPNMVINHKLHTGTYMARLYNSKRELTATQKIVIINK